MRSAFTSCRVAHPDGKGHIEVRDIDGAVSVTNDAEAVVLHCLSQYCQFGENYPIYYQDTEGSWDELKHDGTKFTGFSFGVPPNLHLI